MKKSASKTFRRVGAAMAAALMCCSMFMMTACGTPEKGDKGDTGAQGAQGIQGEAGKDGTTPHIGENGNWWIGETDTGIKATGSKGDKGDKGDTGASGVKGPTGPVGPSGKPIVINPDGSFGDTYTASPEITADGTKTYTNIAGNYDVAKGGFHTAYQTLAEAQEAAHTLAVQVAAEGDVLLKNENEALPLAATERKVTLLGIRNARMIRSGFGSGSGGGSAISTLLADSLEAEGFSVNKKMLEYYTKQVSSMVEDKIVEPDPDAYGKSLTATYKGYNDAAIVVLSRTGAENFDIATSNALGHSNTSDHALQLMDNEAKLIKQAKANFKKVIVIINSSNIMQIPELAEEKTDTNYGVDGIIWVGSVGQDGTTALAKILTGEITPSGHTVDLWEKDFKKSPVWTNFGTNTQTPGSDSLYYYDGKTTEFATIENREGIYYGHQYYETRYADAVEKAAKAEGATEATIKAAGDAAYENVLYPFGHGLSYTTFEWKLDNVLKTGKITAPNQEIEMRVWVKNTGSYPGKDVVQLYVNTPYTTGGIEKAEVRLAGFAKTKLLQPGESDVVSVKVVAQELASFDWNDANLNGFKGYELEAGDYKFIAAHNSHEFASDADGNPIMMVRTVDELETADAAETRVTTAANYTEAETAADKTKRNRNGKVYGQLGTTGILCKTDLVTGEVIEPVYTMQGGKDYSSVNASYLKGMISRADEGGLQQPANSSKEDRTLDKATYDDYRSQYTYHSYMDKVTDPYYAAGVPSSWNQATSNTAKLTKQLSDMTGVRYYEAERGADNKWAYSASLTEAQKADNAKWDEFMNQFTWEELCSLPTRANNLPFANDEKGNAVYRVDVGEGYGDPDGPINAGGVQFPSNPILCATYNTDLALLEGTMVGNLLLLNGSRGWRGTGTDIHRSPFSGRNFEYFSEDGMMAGLMVSEVTRGVTQMGIIAHIKHFYGNDQEAYRADYGGVFCWATEQALREQTAKPFEHLVKYGGCIGMMNSFNRIGKWTQSNNYASRELLLHKEWGFRGSVEGDAWAKQYVPIDLGVRGGDDELLSADSGYPDCALERGYWDADKKCVRVAATEKEYNDAGGYLSPKAKGNGGTVELTNVSYTHYYAVRKAAQRLLMTMANSAVAINGFKQTEEVTLTFTKGVYNEIKLNIPGKTDDLSDLTFASGTTWPKGLSYDAKTGMVGGVPTGEGMFGEDGKSVVVSATYVPDVWIKVRSGRNMAPLTVNYKFALQSDLMIKNGTAAAAHITDGMKVNSGTSVNLTITPNTLKYGDQLKIASNRNQRIMNTYIKTVDGKTYHRDEDKSAADIVTLGNILEGKAVEQLADLDASYIYGFFKYVVDTPAIETAHATYKREALVKGLPAGLTVTAIDEDILGWMGKDKYSVNTGITISGTAAAGTYEIEVTMNVPYVNKSTNPWMSAGRNMLTYTQTFTLVVA